mgnify:FL=1
MRLIDADALKRAIATIMPSRVEVNLVVDDQPDAIVRCKDCIYAEQTMFDNEFKCYFDEENESGCKRTHKGDWFCADGERR